MIHFHYEPPERNYSATDFPICLIQQFYVDSHAYRHEENVFCLQKNVNNPHIQSIYLLNEREYTPSELGVSDPLKKIKQTILGNRLLYSDVFAFVRRSAIEGYIVFANTDIFLDESIAQLRHTNLHSKKQMYALLRYEYNPNSQKSQLFGPRYDSQDTWIFHSSQNIKPEQEKVLRFAFGKPGCDNKFVYVTSMLGYALFNEPLLIKTYHYHTSRLRNYSSADRLGPPYSMLIPHGVSLQHISASFGRLPTSDIGEWSRGWTRFSWEKDNRTLKLWIETNLNHKTNMIIAPNVFIDSLAITDLPQEFSNIEKHKAASYFRRHLIHSMTVIGKTALEAYHFVHAEPWTSSFRGCNLLFAVFHSKKVANTLRDKWSIREHIYGFDFFPECKAEIRFIEQSNKRQVLSEYDVIITDKETEFAIQQFKMGKSVVVFEPFILSLLFGIFDTNTLKTRPDILRLYMNQFWTKIE